MKIPLKEAALRLREVSASPRLDAELLLCAAAGFTREQLISRGEENECSAEAQRRFCEYLARREVGEPVAYILGEKEFYGRDFLVNRSVLIPRPETELLVEYAVREAVVMAPPISILDLGTGSGCIATSVQLELQARGIDTAVTAVDTSDAALAVAEENANRLGSRVRFLKSSWFEAVRGERFDLILVNPPYVAKDDERLEEYVRRFEPHGALFADRGGLAAIEEVLEGFPSHRTERGVLFMECGLGQREKVEELSCGALGGEFLHRWVFDLQGVERVFVLSA